MRGYYYDQTGGPPEHPGADFRRAPPAVERRSGGAPLSPDHGPAGRPDCGGGAVEPQPPGGAAGPGRQHLAAPSRSGGAAGGNHGRAGPHRGRHHPHQLPLPSGGAHSLQEIYRENIASIVSIRGSKGDGMSLGTGVVMSEDGYIITNSHVIEGCGAVDVVLQDERVFQALLVGQDAQSDLAVLKIDCAGLTPAQFGDSTLLEVGDAVAAIGNPLGEELRGTMTDGIVSAINRDVNVDGYTMVLLQTTAALNSGNSGGALINDRGQVVGITNLKMRAYDNTVEGLGFAIPTTTVKTVVDALIAHGRVEGRPTIGITGYTVTEELAEEYGCPRGVAVQSVREGSDAQRQGVLPNDVIVAVNGETITDMDQLQAIKEGLAVGDVLTFRLWRGGHYLERDVALVDQYTLEE